MMRSNRRLKIPLAAALLGMIASWAGAFAPQQDLILLIGENAVRISSRLRDGVPMYRLRDLLAPLDLKQREDDEELRLVGPGGMIRLNAERSVLRVEDQYVQLSGAVWRTRRNEWYVPEDFLTRGLPLALDGATLRSAGIGRYRLEVLKTNRVDVRLNNYPDKLRVVFEMQHPATVRTTESRGQVLVEFRSFRVLPRMTRSKPDPEIASSIDFIRTNVYGAFRIRKGPLFRNYREFSLQRPYRYVLDLFSSPRSDRRPDRLPLPETRRERREIEPRDPIGFPSRPIDSSLPVVILDPGHGGRDAGALLPDPLADEEEQAPPDEEEAATAPQLSEKALALEVCQAVSRRLDRRFIRAMLTRTRDVDLNLEQRSSIANFYRSSAFVSVHVSESRFDEASGPVVYVHRYLASGDVSLAPVGEPEEPEAPDSEGEGQSEESSTPHSKLISDALAPLSGPPPRPSAPPMVRWEDGQRMELEDSRRLGRLLQEELNRLFGSSNSMVEVPLAILEPVRSPAVVIELGFASNPDDAAKLRSPEFREQLAHTIAQALERFLP